MDENPMNKSIVAARSRRASRSIRIVLLVGVVAALASAAVLAGPQSHNKDSGAWPQRVAQLMGGTHSDTAGFANVVDAVKPAVIGVQTKRALSSEERAQLGASSAGRTVSP